MSVNTWLVNIPATECEELLASVAVGRLGVMVDGRPEIFPISHCFDPEGRCVSFATNDGLKLRAALDWPYVSFEVDGLDPDGRGGWSVLVVGHAERIVDPEHAERLAGLRQVPWGTYGPVTWVRIVPEKITGYRISAVDG